MGAASIPAAPAIAVKVRPPKTAVRVEVIGAKAIQAPHRRVVNGANKVALKAAAKDRITAAKPAMAARAGNPKAATGMNRVVLKGETKAEITAARASGILVLLMARAGTNPGPKVAITRAKVTMCAVPDTKVRKIRVATRVVMIPVIAVAHLKAAATAGPSRATLRPKAPIIGAKASRAAGLMRTTTRIAGLKMNMAMASRDRDTTREIPIRAKTLKIGMTKAISEAMEDSPLSMVTKIGMSAVTPEADQTMKKMMILVPSVRAGARMPIRVGNA